MKTLISLKNILYILLPVFLLSGKLFAQEKAIQGIVFDKDTKQRLARVYIYNVNTSKGFYNNSKGEFSATASQGDILVAALQGYSVDTVSVGVQNTVLFYLKRTTIQLREVTVRDTLKSPQEKLKQTQKEYHDAYTKGNVKEIFTPGSNQGTGGSGLSINTIYNLLSKEGRNARELQKIIERDYNEAIISYRYTASLVSSVTGLKGEGLTDFMQQYRPSYNFVIEANDYQLIEFIKNSYQRYKENPAAFRLPPLKTPKP
ncbi:MAG TPA: carboxypeptidase-like regulatory domain-containing protein [Daejeonella sp.]|nr:carboxypeptidase-like regulatory domain-containing protein [Daejeonella sp.]